MNKEMVTKAVVSYVVETALGGMEAGSVVELDQEKAQPLVDAGFIREATEDELGGGEEEEVEEVEAPEYVANAARKVEQKVTAAVEAVGRKLADKMASNKAVTPNLPKITVRDNVDPTWGFKSLGDFTKTVIKKSHGDFSASKRFDQLTRKAQMETGGGPTVTATDGGNLIPPAYAATLFDRMKGVTNLLDFCQDEPFTGNTLEVPVDNTTSFTNGVRAYWTDEADAITDSTLPLTTVEIKLKNLACLVNVTDYLLEDNAYSLDNYLGRHVPVKMVSELNKSVLYGSGSGANVVGNAATISVTRTTANRIVFADIIGMRKRMSEWNLPNAKWYISPSIQDELLRLAFPDASGSFPIFTPTGNVGGYPSAQYAPGGMLYGNEVVLCSNMQALGNTGDILFADLSAVSKIQKALDGKATPYLYFDKAISTLRFILRVGTASRWPQPFTRPDTVTCSPFVKLTGGSVSI